MQTVSFGGTNYSIPNRVGENGWAVALTTFLAAVAANAQTTSNQKFATRVAATSPVTVAATDFAVICKLTVAGAVTVNLPAGVARTAYLIKDGTGDAATNNITIDPSGAETIEGASTFVINENNGSVLIIWDSTSSTWRVIAEYVGANPKFTGMTLSGMGTGLVHSSSVGLLSSSTLVDADVSASAGITRSKLASGSASHVLINDGAGVMSSEAQLAVPRGGTGVATLAAGALLYGAVTSAMTPLAIGTASQVLMVNAGATAPQWTSAINGVSIGVTTPAAGSFTTVDSTGAASLGPASGGTTAHVLRGQDFLFTTGTTTSTTQIAFAVLNNSTTNGSSSRVFVRADAGNVAGILQANKDATSKVIIGASTAHSVRFVSGVALTDTGGYTTVGSWDFLAIESTPIGGTTAAAGRFTTLQATGLSTGIVHSGAGGAFTSSTLVDADVSASAAIARTKLASGTASHVLINDGAGVMTSEASLAVSRGGTGVATLAAGAMLYGAVTSAMVPLAIGTAKQLLMVNAGATAPAWTSAIDGVSIGVTTPAAGSFTTLAASGIVTLPGNTFARGHKSADVTGFTSGTETMVYMPTIVTNIGSGYAAGTADHQGGTANGSIFTVPAGGAGTYHIEFLVWVNSSAAQFISEIQSKITVQGVSVAKNYNAPYLLASNAQSSMVSATIVLAVGDVVKFFVYASVTGGGTYTITGVIDRTNCSIVKVA